MTSPYDVERLRSDFPALADGTAYFDGPGGSQAPRQVAEAIAGALTAGLSNRDRGTASGRRADDIVLAAREAAGDLVGADPRGVIFGRSMTALTYELSRALAKHWRPGDEVVVTSLDHDANIRPWAQAASTAGARVRWAEMDPHTAELPTDAVTAQLTRRTRLVAVTGASNLLGTRPDVAAIARAAHGFGALVYVDGVHLTPHASVDLAALGADFFAASPYKFLGPHLGLVAADPTLLESLRPDKLLASGDDVPERFELGTLPYELLAGTTAAIDFLAGLVPDPSPDPQPGTASRRERLLASMTALEVYEASLRERLEAGLRPCPGVTIYSNAARRAPTTLFTVAGTPPREVAGRLAERDINAPAHSFYAIEASRRLRLGDGGGVRAGIAPYTSSDDVDRLVAAVAELVN
ncbi:MAG: cysteine desulfurase-like protein [Pseudonocardiales bacterium]|nr:MAG: cysteine desulfurase-like protein [Pseudonocardiales bacterium]